MPEGYSEEPSVSGTQAIKKLRGVIETQKRVESRFEATEFDDGKGGKRTVQPKDQIQVHMTDVAILEMYDDAEEPDLTDGGFTFWIPFAQKGQPKAHPNSPFQKCWVDTAKEAYGKAPSQLNGEWVTLEKLPVVLFSTNVLDAAGEPVLNPDGTKKKNSVLSVDKAGRPKYFCFVKDEGGSGGDIVDYVKGKVVGKTAKVALREVVMDARIKQFPQYKTLLETNPEGFASELGLKYVSGRFE